MGRMGTLLKSDQKQALRQCVVEALEVLGEVDPVAQAQAIRRRCWVLGAM